MSVVVTLFGLGLGAAVLIVGFVTDVGETVAQAAPFALAAALVLMAGAWFAAWGVLRGHGVAHPRAVTSWSLAMVVLVSVITSVLAGFLAFFFSVLSFVFTMSGQALSLILVLAAVCAAVPTLLAGLLAVPGLSRAYRPADPAIGSAPVSSLSPAAPAAPAAPPVRI